MWRWYGDDTEGGRRGYARGKAVCSGLTLKHSGGTEGQRREYIGERLGFARGECSGIRPACGKGTGKRRREYSEERRMNTGGGGAQRGCGGHAERSLGV